jgi:hypothetical protein
MEVQMGLISEVDIENLENRSFQRFLIFFVKMKDYPEQEAS